MARDNRTLGRFHLDGIPPAPRGVPQIEVTFDIDANGILNVSAKDTATGKQQHIAITSSSGLSKDEIDKMVKEAEANAADDARHKQEIEVRNQTDSLIYSTERTLSEHGSKLAEADRKAIDDALAEAKEALKTDDLERMKRAQETLSKAAHKLGDAKYREAQAQAGQQPPGPGAGSQAGGAGPRPWPPPAPRGAEAAPGGARRGPAEGGRGPPVELAGPPFPPCAVCAARGRGAGVVPPPCLGRGARRGGARIGVAFPAGVDSGM